MSAAVRLLAAVLLLLLGRAAAPYTVAVIAGEVVVFSGVLLAVGWMAAACRPVWRPRPAGGDGGAR